MGENNRIDVYLICNAKYHDTNFVRLELLKLLAEHEDIMVRVAEDYSDIKAINQAELLITYTCDLCPTPEQQEGLKQFMASGKRWFALHATNALIEFVGEPFEVDSIKVPGKADTPNKALVAVLLIICTGISSALLQVSLAIRTSRNLPTRLACTLSVWAHISVFRLELVTALANPHNHPFSYAPCPSCG
jgi:hypothetical protein